MCQGGQFWRTRCPREGVGDLAPSPLLLLVTAIRQESPGSPVDTCRQERQCEAGRKPLPRRWDGLQFHDAGRRSHVEGRGVSAGRPVRDGERCGDLAQFVGGFALAGIVQPGEGAVGRGQRRAGLVVAVEVAQGNAEVEADGFTPGRHPAFLEVGQGGAQGDSAWPHCPRAMRSLPRLWRVCAR